MYRRCLWWHRWYCRRRRLMILIQWFIGCCSCRCCSISTNECRCQYNQQRYGKMFRIFITWMKHFSGVSCFWGMYLSRVAPLKISSTRFPLLFCDFCEYFAKMFYSSISNVYRDHVCWTMHKFSCTVETLVVVSFGLVQYKSHRHVLNKKTANRLQQR